MLEDWQGGEAAVRYHVTYTAADGELKSYYINPVSGEIISRDGGAIAGAGGYPTVPAEEAKQLAVNYICNLDGVSEDDIAVADCVITYDENGYPRQYVTMTSLKDAKTTYYAYVYDKTVPSGIPGNIYGGKQSVSGISENEALNIVLEKQGVIMPTSQVTMRSASEASIITGSISYRMIVAFVVCQRADR